MVAMKMNRDANREATRVAANAVRARNRDAVLAACRRPGESTAAALASATGLSEKTCLAFRAELLAAGLIEKTWGDRGRRGEFGLSPKDGPAIRARTARVRAAKRRLGGLPLPLEVLAQILPA